VTGVVPDDDGYRVATDRGDWWCRAARRASRRASHRLSRPDNDAGASRLLSFDLKAERVLLHATLNAYTPRRTRLLWRLGLFNLPFLAQKLLGRKIKAYKEIVPKEKTFLELPFEEMKEHACTDADVAFQLHTFLEKELKDRKINQQALQEVVVMLRTIEQARIQISENTALPGTAALRFLTEKLAGGD